MFEYDEESAWAARVQRGANLLDEALLTHEWRDKLIADGFEESALDFGVDIREQLCRLSVGACPEAVQDFINSRFPFGFRPSMFDLGFDYEEDEFGPLHRAWARYLTADAAAVRDAA